jgi:hypothetical protein
MIAANTIATSAIDNFFAPLSLEVDESLEAQLEIIKTELSK